MTQQPTHETQRAWTLGSGLFTIGLAVVAALLPLIDWAPRGGLVGWLLFLAGCAELAFGSKRGADFAGKAAIGSGLITAIAGLALILNPSADYYPVAHVVMAWLLLRGAWVIAMAFRSEPHPARMWVALSGAADILLAILLMMGLSSSAFVVALFGPTPEVVAQFSLILGASFLATGVCQVAIALARRPLDSDR